MAEMTKPTETETSHNLFDSLLHPKKTEAAKPKRDPIRWYRVRNPSKYRVRLINTSKEVVTVINPDSARVMQGATLEGLSGELLQFSDDDSLDPTLITKEPLSLGHLEGEGRINIADLIYQQDREYTLTNLTSKRITIQHNAFKDRGFFVPAFGSRVVNGKILLDLNYTAWESQGLVQIDPLVDEVKSSGSETIINLLVNLFGFALLICIILALIPRPKPLLPLVTWSEVGALAVIGFLVVATSLLISGRNNHDLIDEIGSWLKLLPGITLVLLVGIGVPMLIVYSYGDGQNLLNKGNVSSLVTLARILQTGFIAIASVLPAFLFYLFGRQQLTKQRENFYREAMILDPNVWSNSEAKNKYDPLLNSVYDSGNSPFSILLLVISTALLVNGWILTLAPVGPLDKVTNNNLIGFFRPVSEPLAFGFLGVYFFIINMIYRRYVRADLSPKTYAYITMRILITVVLVWAVSALPDFQAKPVLRDSLSLVAFMIGIFPEAGLTLIQNYVRKITKQRLGQDPDVLALTKLEGMNLYDQARLLEEGIENIENLAHHNLMELIVRTRIPTPRLVDMFDQAILYLHLGKEDDDDSDTNPSESEADVANASQNNGNETSLRGNLKELGIRTATDLLRCQDKIKDFNISETEKTRLGIIITALGDDEWLTYINNWRTYSSQENKPPIEDAYKFYHRATGIEPEPEKKVDEPVKEIVKIDNPQTQPSLPPVEAIPQLPSPTS